MFLFFTEIFTLRVDEYVQALLAEFQKTYENQMADELARKSHEEDFPYDFITIRTKPSEPNLNLNQIFYSQCQIMLDQLTPLTLGSRRR